MTKAWDLSEYEVDHMLGSQARVGIIKVKEGVNLPAPKELSKGKAIEDRTLVFNCLDAKLDVDIENGGRVVILTKNILPILGDIGLGADFVTIDSRSMCSPGFSSESAFQVAYILKGSGRVQVVGIDGESTRYTNCSLVFCSLCIISMWFLRLLMTKGCNGSSSLLLPTLCFACWEETPPFGRLCQRRLSWLILVLKNS